MERVNYDSPQPSEARLSHRLWIAGRVATLLSHYWRSDDPPELIEAIVRDWCDVLEHLPQDLIQRAVVQHIASPQGRKPTPGDIRGIAQAIMPAPKLVSLPRPPEPERHRVTAAEAEKIMTERGFRPKKFGGNDAAE